MKKVINYLLIVLLLFGMLPVNIMAKEATIGSINISGATLSVGETKTLTIGLSSNMASADGYIVSNDSSCVQVVSVDCDNCQDNYFMNISTNKNPITTAGTVTVKGLKNCQTTLKVTGASLATKNELEETDLDFTSGVIVVGESAPKSNNNNLNSLTVSKGSLSPEFNSNTTTYQVEVGNDVTSIDINATLADSKARVDGIGTKSLNVGSNTIDVIVTAEDGTPKTYKIIVVRSSGNNDNPGGNTPDPTPVDTRSKDNSLKSLEVVGYSIEPSFDSSKQDYTLTVENGVTTLNINAIPNDEKSSVTINGNGNLNVGINNVNVVVTAEDGSQKIYTIKVIRKNSDNKTPQDSTNKSSENRLKTLIAAEGAFKSNFDQNVNTYDITVASDVDSLNITAIPVDSKANVKIDNNFGFVQGETKVVNVIVTAEDGSQRVYTINVKKSDKEADTKLTDIKIDGETLEPKFSPDTFVYTTAVGSGTKTIKVHATPANKESKVEYSINGGLFTTSENLDLKEGSNIIVIKVTDKNGLTSQYIVNVERDSSSFKIFGIKIPKWLGYLLLFLTLLLIGLLIFLLLKKRKKKQEQIVATQAIPNIEIKPEFNFNSKNEDNDEIDDGGILNQNSSHISSKTEDNDSDEEVYDQNKEEIPYDPYDEIVTKDEIIDAINEKDPEKLKILYKQEMLNREKEMMKESERAKESNEEE